MADCANEQQEVHTRPWLTLPKTTEIEKEALKAEVLRTRELYRLIDILYDLHFYDSNFGLQHTDTMFQMKNLLKAPITSFTTHPSMPLFN